jgi:hypothetical protein
MILKILTKSPFWYALGMGGSGSGNWYRWQGKKSTVEESLVVAVKDIRKRLYHGASGTLSWTQANGENLSIGYAVTLNQDTPTLTLSYRWPDSEDVRIPVRLESTPTQFGGKRWWFVCPLIVDGIPCHRRAGKLYLPPGAKYFGCRVCHDLTYRSSQEAHQEERLFDEYRLAREDLRRLRTLLRQSR